MPQPLDMISPPTLKLIHVMIFSFPPTNIIGSEQSERSWTGLSVGVPLSQSFNLFSLNPFRMLYLSRTLRQIELPPARLPLKCPEEAAAKKFLDTNSSTDRLP